MAKELEEFMFGPLLVAVFCALTSGLMAMPSQVLLIRHAEKTATGNGLAKAGFQRASALVPFFTLSPQNAAFQLPVVIYAQAAGKNRASTRPVQTVSPLANALGVELIAQYTKSQYKTMVDEIKTNSAYAGQTVLICWNHQDLGTIAAEFGVSPTPTYPSGVFDRLWVIDLEGDQVASFQDLPQQLMYGDSGT